MTRLALLLGLGGAGLAVCPAAPAQDAAVREVDRDRDITVAVSVETLDGRTVYGHRAHEPLVLASNQKLFTTAAALLRLPADYRWVTRVELMDGDRLWFRGGGDPSLRRIEEQDHAEDFLDAVAAALVDRGVRELEEVVLDDRFFDRAYRHDLWPSDQWQSSYCAPVSGLAVEGNCIVVDAAAGGRLELRPPLGAALRVDRKRSASGTLAAWWQDGTFGISVRHGRPATAVLAVNDPGEAFRFWVEEGLRRRGVAATTVRLVAEDEVSGVGELLLAQPSAWTLAEAVAVANKDSDNFVTETILKTLGAEGGFGGSFAGGIEAMRAALAELGMELEGFDPADGSGLARRWSDPVNEASPASVCALLRAMAHEPSGRVLFDSLPVGGLEGRMSERFRDPLFAPHRVRAKTGWIRGASSLSGYLLAGEDEVLVFSIVVNYRSDFTARTHNSRFRALQEEILAEVLRRWPLN